MRVLYSNESTSPYFNLATEQFLLEGDGDIFMLWQNAQSVIIGKNQNTYAEVDVDFCKSNNITIARRLTGGGAVFHDLGNVNFTFITDAEKTEIDFSRFLNPIIEMLSDFGIQAVADGRNDLVVDGSKISGNAQCVYDTHDGRKRLLHHGTLLFSADVSKMSGALKVNREKLESKGIKSVSSRVVNICDIRDYNGPRNTKGFISALSAVSEEKYGVAISALQKEEIEKIKYIAKEKFSTWDWNFGKSPEYNYSKTKRYAFGTVSLSYTANHGIIEKAEINGDFFGTKSISELTDSLVGTRLDSEDIIKRLNHIEDYIHGATVEDILSLIF